MNMFKNSFIKYVFFAILTSAINVGLYLLVYNYVVRNILISNCVAYSVSITFSFITNKKLVFNNSSNEVFKEVLLFLFVKGVAFCLDSIVLVVCLKWIHIPNSISKLIANCSTTFSNYSLNKKLVFKDN